MRRLWPVIFVVGTTIVATLGPSLGESPRVPRSLASTLAELASGHPGRVGVCVQAQADEPVCINGDHRFSLQSVMKLVVGVTVMRAVDDGQIRLDDAVTIRRTDLSANVQPIAEIVERRGTFTTTIGDLVARAIIESDSTAADVLIDRIGGLRVIKAFLQSHGFEDIRIDRYERDLQAETNGLTWKADYVFPKTFAAAKKQVSDAARRAAFDAYLKDERDTATPRAMTRFLAELAAGNLLTSASTRHLLGIMLRTRTSPDRLRAGVPEGWPVGHKTGTSQTVGGRNGATNDVGLIFTPEGDAIAISAFVAGSTASSAARAALIAAAARAATATYR